jgi:hypothetical protein
MRSKSNQEQSTKLKNCFSCDQPVVLVAFCPQCNGMICAECLIAHRTVRQLRVEHQPTMLNEFKHENIESFINNQMLCKEKYHEKNKLEYYCQEETCRRCICQKCFALFHRNHDISSLEEAAEEVKQVIQQDMNRVNQLKEKYEEELVQSRKNMERIKNENDLAKRNVHDVVEAIHKMASLHETTMIKALHETLSDQTIANDEEQSDIKTELLQPYIPTRTLRSGDKLLYY